MKAKFKRNFKYMGLYQYSAGRETTLTWFKEWVARMRPMRSYHEGVRK